MGNKLCAPLLSKKAHPQHNQPFHSRKDSHLLRLWAEIFRVHGNGDYMQWKRVSEDVVPVNITCIEDTPKTVFQVTAYNRHVEKIFDVRILQPGTILCPATDCFVHWRDLATSSEWGLNFTTSQDAKRFRDCCSFPSQKFARKASSANSLRLSPPKGKGKAVSSPNSPVHDPRRVISTPYDLNKTEPCECIASAGDREALAHSDKAATMPRSQAESSSNGGQSNFQPRGILKSSNSSTNDSVGRNAGRLSVNIDKSATFHEGQQHVYKGSRSSSAGPLADNQRPVAGQFSSFGKAPTSSRTCENVRVETAFVGKIENTCDLGGRKSVTIATTAPKEMETTEPTSPVDVEPDSQSSVTVHKDCIRILAPQPQKLLPESPLSGGSRDSVSPEWPSPPEPLTPQTPLTPVYNMEFDSDCIKKMLENLPVSPECESLTSSVHENDQGFHDDASCGGWEQCCECFK